MSFNHHGLSTDYHAKIHMQENEESSSLPSTDEATVRNYKVESGTSQVRS